MEFKEHPPRYGGRPSKIEKELMKTVFEANNKVSKTRKVEVSRVYGDFISVATPYGNATMQRVFVNYSDGSAVSFVIPLQ